MATRMLEHQQRIPGQRVLRDLDYLIQTNLLAFMVFWRIEKLEQALKYVELCRNYVYMVLSQAAENETVAPETLREMSTATVQDHMVQILLQSDHEDPDFADGRNSPAATTRRPQVKPHRLSLLSKINLLGLVSLAEIALRFRLGQVTLKETLAACRLAVDDLKGMLAQHAHNTQSQVGIAS